ncbi:MAG: right-handed parallel beta-helix repeat-containing protein, partial [Phaeodactylibacter sp.]|nr:right-handed parallel beta-helix repeat-containing protein [Phaeodactylibacter sp.]
QEGVQFNDYNNFYTEPGVNWLANLTTGAHCHSVDPGFLDDTDLHVSISDLADAGVPLPEVSVDFDGEVRDLLMPDIGADEIQPFALDMGVLDFVAPIRFIPYCDGPPEFVVTLKNYGSTTLESAEVVLEINDLVQAVINWSGSLAYLEETTLNFGAFPLTDTENYNLRCYTQLPNGLADEFPNNDAAEFEAFHLPLSGTYTLGGAAPDFNTLTELNANLINAGLCGPTTILIRDGTYDDNIYVDTLPGSSAVNTLTITSESGDSSAVVITDEFPSPYEQLIYFDQVSYLTISHLTLDDDGADLKDLIRIRSGHDITISNCELIGYYCNACAQTTEKGIYALNIDSNLTVRNNFIYQNTDGFWLTGDVQTGMFTSVNFLIENNRVFNTVLVLNAVRPRLLNNRFSGRFSKLDHCQSFEIAHNIFEGGFALFSSSSFDEPGLFYNNALSHYEPNGASVSWDWALYLNGATNTHIYHNTMKGAFNAGAIGLYFSKEVELFNNIFYQGAYNSNLLLYQASSIGVTSDYNIFFRSDSLASILTTRQDLFQQDFNSYFIDPQFSAHPDSLFYPTNGLMNNLAEPLGLEVDLFLELRNLDFPDMGAIEFEAPPVVDLGPDQVLCAGTTLNALNPGSTYLWSDGSDGQTLEVDESGSYWVHVSNDLGMAADTVQIDIIPAPVLQLEDAQNCAGETVLLSAGVPDLEYLWSTGDTTEQVSVVTPGTYTLTVTNAEGCSTTDSLTVTNYPVPGIQLLVDNESCPGLLDGSLTAVVSGGQGVYSYA